MTWPFLTDPSLNLDGKFKSTAADFIVEEIPSYLPSGSGEHLVILVEKTGLTTDQLVNRLSRLLHIKAQHIGYAGKKDRIGITKQRISIWKVKKEQVKNLQIPGVRILDMEYHRNKLRLGHSKGNQFTVRLTETEKKASTRSLHILDVLKNNGVPNYFGPQRFGVRSDNPAIGLAILSNNWSLTFKLILGNPQKAMDSATIYEARRLFDRGQYRDAISLWPKDHHFPQTALRRLVETKGDFERAGNFLPKNQINFYIHSLQSYLFNATLAKRLPVIDKIWQGDLAYLHRNGAVFIVVDPKVEQKRADNFEISPSGPIWGKKTILPEGEELQVEETVLQDHGFEINKVKEIFAAKRIVGGRRSFRIPLNDYLVEEKGDELILKFSLPTGSYATAVIRELLKETNPEIDIPDLVV